MVHSMVLSMVRGTWYIPYKDYLLQPAAGLQVVHVGCRGTVPNRTIPIFVSPPS